jgi:acetyl-CoA C-acetyltransferase
MANDIVIAGVCRTAIGRFLGTLAPVKAWQLGGAAIKGALERSGVKPEQVDEVIMGNVVSAGRRATRRSSSPAASNRCPTSLSTSLRAGAGRSSAIWSSSTG